ncbi:MAG: hypothetical protein HW416_1635 [Chloroflexi bacterium]|nr:hypothetical protein [Chloroflexota bacterium]
MPTYLIETPHTMEECAWSLKQILDHGTQMLDKFNWGCMDDEHRGWAIVEAANKFEAQDIIPTILRSKARIIELQKFTADEVRAFHAR